MSEPLEPTQEQLEGLLMAIWSRDNGDSPDEACEPDARATWDYVRDQVLEAAARELEQADIRLRAPCGPREAVASVQAAAVGMLRAMKGKPQRCEAVETVDGHRCEGKVGHDGRHVYWLTVDKQLFWDDGGAWEVVDQRVWK
jgi:hypothetical protein